MRVAPVGLYFSGSDVSIEESDLIGAKAVALTHSHDLGYIPDAALVHIIRAVAEKRGFLGIKKTVYEERVIEVDDKTYQKMKKAQRSQSYGIDEMMLYDEIFEKLED